MPITEPKKNLSISAFFPFLNDWGTIGSMVAAVNDTLAKVANDYEIIVIDDGSDAMSKDMLRSLTHKYPQLRVIEHERNKGYGGAIRSGISASTKDWIFYTDGDAQYDPRDLTRLLSAVDDSIDIVNGYKIKRADPLHRVVIGRIYHYTVKFLFGLPLRDTDCDFRLMRKIIFDKVKLESNSGIICVELIKKITDAGFKFAEVPVPHYWRTSGKSQFFNFPRVFKVGLGILRLWYKLVWKKEHSHTVKSVIRNPKSEI
jgi:glycosyltransferase involved in cell wall biosynthesis